MPTVQKSEMSELLDSLTTLTGSNIPAKAMQREVMRVAREALQLHNALQADNARLRAIVDKLPKTADGVPVVPGMEVWAKKNPSDSTVQSFIVCQDSVWASRFGGMSRAGAWLISKCYSTREAAEAAGKDES